MASHYLKPGETKPRIPVRLRSSTTGQGLTGVAYGSVTAYYSLYNVDGTSSGPTVISFAANTVNGDYSSATWIQVSAANQPGVYQCDLPIACAAATVRECLVTIVVAGAIDAHEQVLVAIPTDLRLVNGASYRLTDTIVTNENHGSGAYSVVLTAKDADTDAVLENVVIAVTSGAERYSVTTPADGEITFNLGAATWTITAYRAGYSFTGTTIVVSDDTTADVDMESLSITAAPAGQVTGYVQMVARDGSADVGATLSYRIRDYADTVGGESPDRTIGTTSAADVNGLLQQALRANTDYEFHRGPGSAPWIAVTTPASGTIELPKILGGL
jgi:hypothetical protein